METVKEVKTAEEILKDHLHGIHFINSDETFDRVISAMTEFASIQTSELKASAVYWMDYSTNIKGERDELKAERDEQFLLLQSLTNEKVHGLLPKIAKLEAENERLRKRCDDLLTKYNALTIYVKERKL